MARDYDKSKERLIIELGRTKTSASGWCIRARVYSYDGAEPKLAFERVKVNDDDSESFRYLGRLFMDEADFVYRMIKKLRSHESQSKIAEIMNTPNGPIEPEQKTEKSAVKPGNAAKRTRTRKRKPQSSVGGW